VSGPSGGVPHRRRLAILLAGLSAVGPFSIDAYLPSFREIGVHFHATPVVVQQTLTAYLLPFAAMTLWQEALSDAYGRRRVTLIMTALFGMASFGCMCASSISMLITFRVLQGLTAGAGFIIGRAIVRDLFEGAEARRLMSRIAVIFAIAPTLGPIIGGWLHAWFGWRAIFAFLTLFAMVLWISCWKALPETLPAARRYPLRPAALLRGYWAALRSSRFVALVLALTLNFSAVFVYIISAPAFVLNLLHRKETEFYWLFGPITVGMLMGTWLAGKVAGRWSNLRTLAVAYGIMAAAATGNLIFHWFHGAMLPWSVVPLTVYVLGNALAMPSLTLMALDLFPLRRGLASSCQGFVQTAGNTVVTAMIAPVLWATAAQLAGGMFVLFVIGAAAFATYVVRQRFAAPEPVISPGVRPPEAALCPHER
jgi:DHA1 family bicyclomycin/chloramphenicol resistance-like MFS transporter